MAHRARAVDLLELVAQAVHRSYYGAYEWSSAAWTDDRKLGRHGVELVAQLTIFLPVFDVASIATTAHPRPDEPKPVPV
jgi:hypothetical protein